MEAFVGLEIKQSEEGISLHLDTFIQELIVEYLLLYKKFIKPKKVPMLPGLLLEKMTAKLYRIRSSRSCTDLWWRKSSLQRIG